MMSFFSSNFSPFLNFNHPVSWKTAKTLVQVFGCVVLAAVLLTGCSDSKKTTEYHSGAVTPGSGGATISSDDFRSTVFVGQADGGGKTEGGGYVAYHGASAVLAQRLGTNLGD